MLQQRYMGVNSKSNVAIAKRKGPAQQAVQVLFYVLGT
jgi:hypothetical protein